MEPMNQSAHVWDAEVYHSHSNIQLEAAVRLIRTIEMLSFNQIIDLGCGDGKITAMLAKALPSASIIGIDASPEMIDFASRSFPKESHRNLEFQLQDIQNLNYSEKFDFICSFFALQWIPDLDSVLRNIHHSLKDAGTFAFIVPLHISLALDQAIQEMVQLPQWSGYFQDFTPGWFFREPIEIQELLKTNQFNLQRMDVLPQEMSFKSRPLLENFILPWLTYLDCVPETLKESFSQQLLDRYLELEPPLLDGSVSYKYWRIECVTTR